MCRPHLYLVVGKLARTGRLALQSQQVLQLEPDYSTFDERWSPLRLDFKPKNGQFLAVGVPKDDV
jgi:hypothetical protein